jgi:hypothetical protein
VKFAFAVAAVLLGVIPAKADSVIAFLLREKIVPVEKLTVPASEFKSDGDPDTVELVLITKAEDGPSRFIEDGDVIFLRPDMPKAAMDRLMHDAQEARVAAFEKRLKAAQTPPQ